MVRMLAEFIMRGRMQAVYFALVGSWLPLVPQATLGLVTMRKGWREGLIVTLAALAPVLFGMYWGKVGSSMFVTSLCMLFASYAQALVLRWSVSWEAALFFVVASSAIVGVVVTMFDTSLQQEVTEFYRRMLENSARDSEAMAQQMERVLANFTHLKASGLIAFGVAVSGLAALFVARWLQAMLYNPGGFKQEFHSLRLSVPLAALAMMGTVYLGLQGDEFGLWAYVCSLPLVICGLGLAHCINDRVNGGYGPLIAMYVILFLFGELAFLIVVFGFSDAFVNYREKFKLKQ